MTLIFSTSDSRERLGVRDHGNECPATRKCKEDTWFKVLPALKDYIWTIDKLLNPNLNPARFWWDWVHLYSGGECYDNGHGYLSLGGWQLETLFTAGATFRCVTGRAVNGWMEVYAIDPKNPPKPPKSLSEIDMTLVHFPTVAAAPYRTEPFPYFNDGRCLHPLIGRNGRAWVQMNPPEPYGKFVRVSTVKHPFTTPRHDLTAGLKMDQK